MAVHPPEDMQQIILEEAAKSELEALRLASVQNEAGLSKNELAGLINVPFTDELEDQSMRAALNSVIPGWIGRVGDLGNPIFDVFNEKISPIVDISIGQDGTVAPRDPLVARYDDNRDGAIDIGELFTAIDDYFAGLIDISQLFTLIDLYFSGPAPAAAAQPPRAPAGLTLTLGARG